MISAPHVAGHHISGAALQPKVIVGHRNVTCDGGRVAHDGRRIRFYLERIGRCCAGSAQIETAITVFLPNAIRVKLLLQKLSSVEVVGCECAAGAGEILHASARRSTRITAFDETNFDLVSGSGRRRHLVDCDGGRRGASPARFNVHYEVSILIRL